MGLFDYLLIIEFEKEVNQKDIKDFFISKCNFQIIEGENNYVSLEHKAKFGDIEVLIEKNKGFSIQTNIKNDVGAIVEIISIIKQFADVLQIEFNIYDYHNRKSFKVIDLQKTEELYIARRTALKEYF